MNIIACGFCAPGPTALIFPVIPTWAAVFVLWCLFRLKYEAGSRMESFYWLAMGAFILIFGAIASIALWSFFLTFWTCRVIAAYDRCADEAVAAGEKGDVQLASVALRASKFHMRMLMVLAAGLIASAIRNHELMFNLN